MTSRTPPREFEVDWSRTQVARARQAVWRKVVGYHWTESAGRHSWLLQGFVYLVALGLLSPHLVGIFGLGVSGDATLIVAGFCVLGLAYMPKQLFDWTRNRFLTNWPPGALVEGYDYGPALVRMDGNGIAWSRALIDQSLAWKAVTMIAEDRDCFIIGTGETLAVMLPKTPSIREMLEAVANGPAGTDAIRTPF